jgi:peptide/nickel transport system permease protein
MVPVILGVYTIVFMIIHFIPGDPVDLILGETARPSDREFLRQELGLDKPVLDQYVSSMLRAARGDMGRSLHTNQPVLTTILKRVPATVELTIGAMIVAVLIALPLGIIAALKQYSYFDNGSMFFALLGISMPNFWLGPLLIILFSIKLGWFPVSGRGGIEYLILPAITLGTALAAILTRMIRSSLLEVKKEDYITFARAKGLREVLVIGKHALSNALIPVVTIMGLQFGALLSGSIITETIFSWPGIGRLTIQAIQTRDYPLVQGCVLVLALSYVLINFLTDLVYGFIDPRIRYE